MAGWWSNGFVIVKYPMPAPLGVEREGKETADLVRFAMIVVEWLRKSLSRVLVMYCTVGWGGRVAVLDELKEI